MYETFYIELKILVYIYWWISIGVFWNDES